MPKKHFLLLVLCWAVVLKMGFGQDNTNAVWNFGEHCRLVFQNGQINNGFPPLFQHEGASSICDENGQLVLFTDGRQVWNRNDSAMLAPNEYLNGQYSSTQAALIVPYPSHKGRYFIFTTAEQAGLGGQWSSHYPSLDVSLVNVNANQGEGAFEYRNQVLLDSTCEKLCSIRGCSTNELWVIGRRWNGNAFYAWKVDSTGIHPPVITNVGIPIPTIADSSWGNQAIGYLKGSYDGKKIASLTSYNSSLELFDFDVNTGILSNPFIDTLLLEPYGACFSPDNSKLYITAFDRSLGWQESQTDIFQYHAQAPSEAAFLASRDTVAHVFHILSGMELGTTGKIYISNNGEPFLSVIHQPNESAAQCNFSRYGQYLPSECACRFGLQNISYIPSPNLPDRLFETDTLRSCDSLLQLEFEAPSGSYQWLHGDTTASTIVHQSGYYTLQYNLECNTRIDSVYADFSHRIQLAMPNDTTLCNEKAYKILPQISPSPYTVVWDGGFSKIPFWVDSSNTYRINVQNAHCTQSDSIHVQFINLPKPNLGPDQFHCNTSEISLYHQSPNAEQLWSTGSTDSVIQVSQTGPVWLQLSQAGCSISDTVQITLFQEPKVEFPLSNTFSPNNDLTNDTFRIGSEWLQNYSFTIYDRWGKAVFESQSFGTGWDGRIKGEPAPDGHYLWCCRYTDPCLQQAQSIKGSVYLIR